MRSSLRAIRGVVDALRTQDVELCDEVIAFDDEIDDRYKALEKQIELVLARQTPVAGDLRLVLALLHSGLHLERMGDQCVTIAKLTKLSSHLDTKQTVIESLVDMGERCEEMVKVSLAAFAERDVEQARGCTELDELIDRANRQVFHEVLGYVHDAEALEWGMRQITVARCFERIGDNAVDIGEQTAFLVTGEFAEFTDASHEAAAARVAILADARRGRSPLGWSPCSVRLCYHSAHQPPRRPTRSAERASRWQWQSTRRSWDTMKH